MNTRRLALAAATLALGTTVAQAQGYRVRLDTRVQMAAYRGVALDSVPVADTVTGPNGGPETRDGFAATCLPGEAYCFFFRPGPERRAAPVVLTADVAAWGLGVPGLSARATARLAGDLRDAEVWPGAKPAGQLLEGYLEYATDRVTAQAGRQSVATRFGYTGFDGGRVAYRRAAWGITGEGYLGLGLARGVALPVNSPALNPLDDFQPLRRQIVAGLGLGWRASWAEARLVYQREVDRRSRYFVSERAGVDLRVSLPDDWTLAAGADADLAAGWLGSAEVNVVYAPLGTRVVTTLGGRRYRPHFELWTIWGAFSPVPYHALHASVSAAPVRGLRVEARGERYTFDEPDAATPLVDVENRGWRVAWSGVYTPTAAWTIEAGYRAEFGPGASSRGFEGRVRYAMGERLVMTLHGATLSRPLEFRYDDATLRMLGASGEYRPSGRIVMQLDGAWFAEERARPDAAAFDWNQLRLSARCVLLFGRAADAGSLPPAVRQMPNGPAR